MKKADRLISLAEASRQAKGILTRGASSELETGAAPTFEDLTEVLHFALGDGRIWLNDQRVVLMQSSVLGRIREEIIDAFGTDTARAMFMRIGYMQGVRDAELIQKRWPHEDLTHALAAGPRRKAPCPRRRPGHASGHDGLAFAILVGVHPAVRPSGARGDGH